MEAKYYDSFCNLYKHLHDVVFTILSETTESNSICTVDLRNSIQQILLETNEFQNLSCNAIMNEIKQNFLILTKENKESYIIDILQQWVQYEPYFDTQNERQSYWIDGMTVSTNYPIYETGRNIIKKNVGKIAFLRSSIFEKYICCCYMKKQQFFSLLKDFCYLRDIDLSLLQEKVATPPQTTKSKDYSELLNALSDYILITNAKEFTNIIQRHPTTPGTPKAIWISDKVDACYFCDFLKMSYKEWNKLFCFTDGKKIHGKYKDKLDKGSPIIEILKSHLEN